MSEFIKLYYCQIQLENPNIENVCCAPKLRFCKNGNWVSLHILCLKLEKKNPTDLESVEVGLKNILLGISFFLNSNIKNTFLNIKKIIPKENRGTKK